MLMFLGIPSQSFAAGDTLVVYASDPNPLDIVIGSDTLASGAQAHSVYKFVSLDTTYIFDGTITVKSSVTFLGVLDPATKRPPCIQPDVLPDNSIPGVLFTFTGNGTSYVLKNLYLLGIAINNVVNYGAGQAVQISSGNIRFRAENVIFENWSQFAVGYSGTNCKFYFYNCKFRNLTTQPTQWYVGEAIRNENYIGVFHTDTLIMRYNTFLCMGGYAACPVNNLTNYFEFSHNSVVYNYKNPFFLHRITNAKFNNNIFYSLYSGGQSLGEYNNLWDETSKEVGAIISLDSLTAQLDTLFDPDDINDPNLRALAEAKRHVEVKNNAYFWPAGLVNLWTAWNDTAHVDSVVTPVWMNQRTLNMFNNNTGWPGFVESGTLANTDPVFGSSVTDVLNPGANGNVGLLNWFRVQRGMTGTTELWGYKITQVVPNTIWIPEWPLPEADDMMYSNVAMQTGGTDGLPLGDPNWFGISVGISNDNQMQTPDEFSLSEAYPNPFNPSTNIKFTIAKSGNVSLKIFNITGQLVLTLLDNKDISRGSYTYKLDMSRFASGIYFYTLQQDNNFIAKKMILLK
jgi:hypothetical protein